MKCIRKPMIGGQLKQQSLSEAKTSSGKVHITLVSDQEREQYRVASYGYLLP